MKAYEKRMTSVFSACMPHEQRISSVCASERIAIVVHGMCLCATAMEHISHNLYLLFSTMCCASVRVRSTPTTLCELTGAVQYVPYKAAPVPSLSAAVRQAISENVDINIGASTGMFCAIP